MEHGTRDDLVTLFTISQAKAACFDNLYIGLTFLCFVRAGAKRVLCPVNGELLAREGDLLIFPPQSFVTLENRPLPNAAYLAEGCYIADELIAEVFADPPQKPERRGIQILPAARHDSQAMLAQLRAAITEDGLPAPIRRHRLLEPLLWLRLHGIELGLPQSQQPVTRLRQLLETDLGHPWRSGEVARHFGMSEASLRRWLAGSGQGFAKILHNTRLERGLGLLQTTGMPISQIALDCGFGTPSHFSEFLQKTIWNRAKSDPNRGRLSDFR